MVFIAMSLCVSCNKDDEEQNGGSNQTLATVTTDEVTEITATTAICGGEVTNENGWAVTERGVCWNTEPNPTPSDSHTVDGDGIGKFTSEITGLTPDTKYYLRAYAKNAAGTSFGPEKSFTTESGGGSSQTLATVTTNEVTEITATTATCGGEVTRENGWAVTERGVCWSKEPNPTPSDSHTVDGDGIGKFTSEITGLTPDTKYYLRAYAKNAAGTSFGPEKSFTTESGGGGGGTGNHEYVDLGLSVKWATCNVGATSPEDYGDYFAWGETTAKSNYDRTTYKWCDGSENILTKYNTDSSYGIVDNKTVLDLADDAATANWGSGWRTPTREEWQELYDNTTRVWTTQNGVYGCLFIGTKPGYTGVKLFLPAAGYRWGGILYDAGSCGYYWSSLLDTSYPYRAWHWYLHGSSSSCMSNHYRYYGHSVRAVRSARQK